MSPKQAEQLVSVLFSTKTEPTPTISVVEGDGDERLAWGVAQDTSKPGGETGHGANRGCNLRVARIGSLFDPRRALNSLLFNLYLNRVSSSRNIPERHARLPTRSPSAKTGNDSFLNPIVEPGLWQPEVTSQKHRT
jgi:hypothetical protein